MSRKLHRTGNILCRKAAKKDVSQAIQSIEVFTAVTVSMAKLSTINSNIIFIKFPIALKDNTTYTIVTTSLFSFPQNEASGYHIYT